MHWILFPLDVCWGSLHEPPKQSEVNLSSRVRIFTLFGSWNYWINKPSHLVQDWHFVLMGGCIIEDVLQITWWSLMLRLVASVECVMIMVRICTHIQLPWPINNFTTVWWIRLASHGMTNLSVAKHAHHWLLRQMRYICTCLHPSVLPFHLPILWHLPLFFSSVYSSPAMSHSLIICHSHSYVSNSSVTVSGNDGHCQMKPCSKSAGQWLKIALLWDSCQQSTSWSSLLTVRHSASTIDY